MVVHACNLSTWDSEAAGLAISNPAWRLYLRSHLHLEKNLVDTPETVGFSELLLADKIPFQVLVKQN